MKKASRYIPLTCIVLGASTLSFRQFVANAGNCSLMIGFALIVIGIIAYVYSIKANSRY